MNDIELINYLLYTRKNVRCCRLNVTVDNEIEVEYRNTELFTNISLSDSFFSFITEDTSRHYTIKPSRRSFILTFKRTDEDLPVIKEEE